MRRYLVVAHQTLASRELLEALKAKAADEDAAFHLVVPLFHGGPGLTWTEGEDRGLARRRLEEAEAHLAAEGLTVTGEVGTESPVDSVDEVLRRDGQDIYTGVIVSTLPHAISKWLKIDAPSRIERRTSLPVDHIIGHSTAVGV